MSHQSYKQKKHHDKQKKHRNFNDKQKLSISLSTAFHTDSEFRSPSSRFFFDLKQMPDFCDICPGFGLPKFRN